MKIQRVGILYFSTIVVARSVYDIKDCPPVLPRPFFAPDATDVHVNDIKLIAGIGDSMMAGFLMDGYDRFFSSLFSVITHGLIEYRGESYTMGGDENVLSIPNFLKVFNPELVGYSVGKERGQICNDYCPDVKYHSEIDVLNAAIVGAKTINLEKELDYLLEAMKSPEYITPQILNGWKLVNFQIGYNDLCDSCDEDKKQYSTPEVFQENVEKAILRIRDAMPRVIVNIIGLLDIAVVSSTTSGQSYCFDHSQSRFKNKCTCLESQLGRDLASYRAKEYNKIFLNLAAKYAATPGSQFAVMFTPISLNTSSLTVEAFSRLDCFHLSTLGHAINAKVTWKYMFSSNRENITLEDSNNSEIYCPTDDDRLATRFFDLMTLTLKG